jgi:single-strand DNA-binding protein
MSNDMNHFNIIGRLTRDPELKYLPSGTAVASFSIAVGKAYKNSSGELVDEVDFFNCKAWSKLGETICNYVKKGHRLGIEGRLSQNSWEDQNGNKRSTVELIVSSMYFLQPKGEGDAAPRREEAPQGNMLESGTEVEYDPNDNPFDEDRADGF